MVQGLGFGWENDIRLAYQHVQAEDKEESTKEDNPALGSGSFPDCLGPLGLDKCVLSFEVVGHGPARPPVTRAHAPATATAAELLLCASSPSPSPSPPLPPPMDAPLAFG